MIFIYSIASCHATYVIISGNQYRIPAKHGNYQDQAFSLFTGRDLETGKIDDKLTIIPLEEFNKRFGSAANMWIYWCSSTDNEYAQILMIAQAFSQLFPNKRLIDTDADSMIQNYRKHISQSKQLRENRERDNREQELILQQE